MTSWLLLIFFLQHRNVESAEKDALPPIAGRRILTKKKATKENSADLAKAAAIDKKNRLKLMREKREELIEVERKAEEREKALASECCFLCLFEIKLPFFTATSSAFIPDDDDGEMESEANLVGKNVFQKTLFYGQVDATPPYFF